MQYTIKDVLSIPLLQSAKLLSANSLISSQPIDSVAVMEMPVEDFVRNNELVLTTAIGCGSNPALFHAFIDEVYSSGAAAMAVATGRHVHDIPQPIIDYCNEIGFPMIELPWELRFADIIKAILEEINQWEQNSLVKTDLIQQDLLKLYLENQTLEDALQYLSNDFDMDVYIRRDDEITSANQSLPALNIDLMAINQSEPSIIHTQEGLFIQIIPLHLSNHEPCHLLLKSKSPSKTPIPWLILNQAVTLLTLWIQREQTKIYNRKKEKQVFLKILLKGNWTSKSDFIRQGEKLGLPIQLPYICIVGYPENLEKFYTFTHNSSIIHGKKEYKKSLSEIIENSAKKLNKQIIYTFKRELVVIFLECTEENAPQHAHTFLDMIDPFVEQNKIPVLSWGIGENHAGKFTFHLSYKNARTALEIGRNHKGAGHRSTYANTGIYQLLATLSNNSAATELMHSTIGAIAAYDKEKGLDFLHTLATYIYHQGNVSQTSRALSLHRQSLLYRLRKIESLTNRSLSDPDDIFLLQLCLRLWMLRFENNGE